MATEVALLNIAFFITVNKARFSSVIIKQLYLSEQKVEIQFKVHLYVGQGQVERIRHHGQKGVRNQGRMHRVAVDFVPET